MIPLSWHVYAGNFQIVKLLLDSGAEINMEFDLNEEKTKATVMDVSSALNKSTKDNNAAPDDFVKTHELLISRGGKTYSELNEL